MRSDGMSSRSRFMLGVLGTGVGINLAGTYVLLTSERRATVPVVGGTQAIAKGAECDAALSPPPTAKSNRRGLW